MIETSNTVSSPEVLASIVALELRRLIADRSRAVVVIEASGLPDEFFDQLVAADNINWTQVIVFLARERAGLGREAPGSLRSRMIERLDSARSDRRVLFSTGGCTESGCCTQKFHRALRNKERRFCSRKPQIRPEH